MHVVLHCWKAFPGSLSVSLLSISGLQQNCTLNNMTNMLKTVSVHFGVKETLRLMHVNIPSILCRFSVKQM